MIKGYRIIKLDVFLKSIIPHTAITPDVLLSDFKDAVAKDKNYTLIFRDYDLQVPLEEIKAYLEENKGRIPEGAIPEDIDAFLPQTEPAPEPEAPKPLADEPLKPAEPKKAPVFKPQKKTAPAPDKPDEF